MSSPGVMMALAALGVAIVLGIFGAPLLAAAVAAAGAASAGYGIWKGMQQEKQTGAALSMLLLLSNLGLAGLMLVLKVFSWV